MVVFHMGNALLGKSFIRASHLGTALEYTHGPINLLRPVIVGFNATGTPTALEFPLWQATAGLIFKLTGSTWYGWANFVSLVLFGTALWPFFQLARHYVGERAAWWATVFFLSEPLIVVMAGGVVSGGIFFGVSRWFLFFRGIIVRTGMSAFVLCSFFFWGWRAVCLLA